MGYSVPIDAIAGTDFRPNPDFLAPGRFRFIVCSDFISKRRLRVVEYKTLPDRNSAPYAAVSYPWNGLKACGCSKPSQFFQLPLEGGQLSDRISFAVLQTACRAARRLGADLLWIDQICIIQTDAYDKEWQIARMFALYKQCKASLVLPGGLQRLAAPDESTNWIERSWTLQEAMPKATYTIFRWRLGSGEVRGLTEGRIDEIEEGQTAMMELGKMLQAAFVGGLPWGTDRQSIRLKIFGPNRDPILALMGVKEARSAEMRDMAVWRSALLRTCSQPRDTILSIMGIFGVTLDVGSYEKDDREKAAADLAFEILKNRRRPSWLGAAPGCGNMPNMCSMPSFPVVDGREVYYSVDGQKKKAWDVIGTGLTWFVKQAAKATMGERGSGRLHLTAKTLRIKLGASRSSSASCWEGFGFEAAMVLNEGAERGRAVGPIHISRSLPQGDYQALVAGLIEHFQLPATAARAQAGAALLMILRWNYTMEGWEPLTYGTLGNIEDVARSWPTCIHAIGC
ncbi:hypothetical protein B0T24DRAFT_632334 [Lasiosphaeria ovina]|uniref:Heterokaryon incompatibility domain-containing protein n=1 Tax=Lasiosphaeria ovina TaxID=92902 RepID=A0AAE0K394_9PEZI|nr:hypothetical protein B0T24DRAFT_632334 [Lasiosphaeria ovina]